MINKAEIDGKGNVVIQNADSSVITVNMNNSEEIKNFLMNFQNHLHELPKKIIDLMEAKSVQEVTVRGANVYLGLNISGAGGAVNALSFGVSITNLMKENRFFNAPFFKLSVPFEGTLDTFLMTDRIGIPIVFPKKLEYGEVASESFLIYPRSKEFIYDKVIAKDPNATIQAIVSTTLGEIYKSNEYSIATLLENFKHLK